MSVCAYVQLSVEFYASHLPGRLTTNKLFVTKQLGVSILLFDQKGLVLTCNHKIVHPQAHTNKFISARRRIRVQQTANAISVCKSAGMSVCQSHT